MMDSYTDVGMQRVDRGLRAGRALSSTGTVVGVGGVALAGVCVVGALLDDSEATALLTAAMVVLVQALVVAVFARGFGAAVEVLAGSYELGLIESIDEDETLMPVGPAQPRSGPPPPPW